MNCPVCDAMLRPIQKHNVDIDICPDCKGIWLDRGELDKILQMEQDTSPTHSERDSKPEHHSSERTRSEHHDDDRPKHSEERDRGYNTGHGKQPGRKSWLGDILGSFGGED